MIDQMIEMYTRAMTAEARGYLVVLAATAVFAVVWRIATTPYRRAVTQPISATELAFLRLETAPVVAALAGLRASGRITRNRRVDRAVQAGPESDPFTDQVLEQVVTDPKHTVAGLLDASRGDLLAVVAESTTVSPSVAMTDPAACWAIRPVLKTTVRVPRDPLSIVAVE